MPSTSNIAAFLPKLALERPHAPAIVFPQGRDSQGRRAYTHLTYAQLDRESDRIARGLLKIGLRRGTRTVLMVRPSLPFFALTFALFKAGIVPVMVDPGLGLRQLKTCLAQAQPQAFIGIPQAHAARILLGWSRDSIELCVTVGRCWGWSGPTLAEVIALGEAEGPAVLADTQPTETAAILFTSGSTGVAKGVVYQHRHFIAQVELIAATYDIEPGEIDLPTFPLFALFDPALGMTTVVPDMDFTRPAQVDPEKLLEAINDFGVTNVFASPALLQAVSLHGQATGTQWRTVKRILTAGAPVQAQTLERMRAMLPAEAQIHTPFGATECLPVASIESREVLTETRARTESGAGVCVGRVVAPNIVTIIGISDGPLPTWADVRVLPAGEIGEIVVEGPSVTAAYFGRDDATALAKIAHGNTILHRMGDVGYLDGQGRLWYCGRKSHRVELADRTLFSAPVEEIFNPHPLVKRTALVGVTLSGVRQAVLCIERQDDSTVTDAQIVDSMREISERHPETEALRHFLLHPQFPVDVRHNAKIGREKLAIWAREKLQ